MIGLLAFVLKIVIGMISVGIVVGLGYLVYGIGKLIPDNKYTTPVKGWIAGGLMICLVIVGIGFPFFAPGIYEWMQHLNGLIPDWLQFWRQATG
jgi:hypothetical protein